MPVRPLRPTLRFGDGEEDELLAFYLFLMAGPATFLPIYYVPDKWLKYLPETLRKAREAGEEGAKQLRDWALDQVVGRSCLHAAKLFTEWGHTEAASVLTEFVWGNGPQTRTFVWNSQFSLSFARSGTTARSVAKALKYWKERKGSWWAQDGTIVNVGNDFSPVSIGAVPLPIAGGIGPIFTYELSPEANIIGSFSYSGRLIGNEQAEWTAQNFMALPSFFAEHYTRHLGIGVSQNHHPDKYGTTQQWIVWRTTLAGEVVG